MKLLIDAYNLVKQITAQTYVTPHEKELFIKHIVRYTHKKGLSAEIVFDGGMHSWPTREHFKESCIVHVGGGHSADTYIKKYCHEHAHGNILLISSDRELVAWARQHGILALKSLDFWPYVERALVEHIPAPSIPSEIKKFSTQEDKELDILMVESTRRMSTKAEDKAAIFKIDSGKKSKSERKIEEKLKKL